MTTVHVVVPDGIDDPARPSGGNIYDRHVCRGLAAIGWTVREHSAPGSWPRPDTAALATLAAILDGIPDEAVVLLDGLVASAVPEVLTPHATRVRLVVLVHMPLGHRPAAGEATDVRSREHGVLSAASAVVTTSDWTKRRILELYALDADRIHIAHPGVDGADLAPGTATGGSLLCVAAVIADKGHDVLLDALATAADHSWSCVCVGSTGREPGFVEALRLRARNGGLSHRVAFVGPETGADLERRYAAADLLVLASRAETYGMVVTEALAHGLPVIATDVGGLTEALGHGADGVRPGQVVPPDDPVAFGAGLRSWLSDAELRKRWRRAARERRGSLAPWSTTTAVVARVLSEVSG